MKFKNEKFSYRTAGASKAVPGFDVIDYGQEDYVFGDTEKDARHWDIYVLQAFEENYSVLQTLFDGEISSETESSSNIMYIVIALVIVIVIIIIVIALKKRRKIK